MVVVEIVSGDGLMMVVSRIKPSTDHGTVTGLKGTPLRIKLALAKYWLKRRR